MDYFLIYFKETPNSGLAVPHQEINTHSNPLYEPIIEGGEFLTWQPVTFSISEGGWADYQPNSEYWHLCSKKLMTLIDKNKGNNSNIQWLDVKITDQYDEVRTYSLLHLVSRLDILNLEKSKIVRGVAIKPVLKEHPPKDTHIFTYKEGFGTAIVVSEALKSILEKENSTGIEYKKIDIVE